MGCTHRKMYMVDTFNSPTFLKKTDDTSLNALDYISDPKHRFGYLTMLQAPMKRIHIKYRICWISKEKYYELFGFDYDNEGVRAKEENILEVEYSYGDGTKLRSRRKKWKYINRDAAKESNLKLIKKKDTQD